jgi:hypothetical protein
MFFPGITGVTADAIDNAGPYAVLILPTNSAGCPSQLIRKFREMRVTAEFATPAAENSWGGEAQN